MTQERKDELLVVLIKTYKEVLESKGELRMMIQIGDEEFETIEQLISEYDAVHPDNLQDT